MSIQWRWLNTACFEIHSPTGEVLVTDPYMDDALHCPIQSEDIQRADLICITHGHFDHILDVGRLANRLGSAVICSARVAEEVRDRFRVPEIQIRPVTAGETVSYGAIQIEVVRGIHVDNRRFFAEQMGVELTEEMTAESMVRKAFSSIPHRGTRKRFLSYLGQYPAGEPLNFIFQFPGNLRCYFLGSTPDPRIFPVAESARAQVLFLQLLWGRERAAFELAQRVGPSVVIPTHHDAFYPGQHIPRMGLVRALFQADPSMTFLEPVLGKWYTTDV